MNDQPHKPVKWIFIAFLILLLNSGYLAAFAEISFFYMLNVLLHVVLGVALVIPFFIYARRFLEHDAPKGTELAIYMGKLGYWFLTPCMLTGVFLAFINATHRHQWILYFHIGTGFLGAVFFQKSIRSVAHKVSVKNKFDVAGRLAWVIIVIAMGMAFFGWGYQIFFSSQHERIVNPNLLALNLESPETLGAHSLFAPSAVSTPTQKNISAESFLNSKSCGRAKCHPDIYAQWETSAHHYSSLNNPWYRKTLELMAEDSRHQFADTTNSKTKTNPVKWCSGCHDPALLVSGMLEQPLAQLSQTPEAQAGISCTACHAMIRVRSTMGQADYVIAETPLNNWANSADKILRQLYDFLLCLDPQPHRDSMMKSFHREDGAEFCSSCHKAHLDKPVNQYRWIRSFNDYDAWQAGPFSGRASRNFLYVPESKTCVDCHMPPQTSQDAGNFLGKIHNHRFIGANTALPTLNNHARQLEEVKAFLQDQKMTVDIFALGKPLDRDPISPPPTRDSAVGQDGQSESPSAFSLATLFAAGDEQRLASGAGSLPPPVSEIIAPLDESHATIYRGDEIRVDVVVRSRNVGHFFPTGTVEANEAWLELHAFDDRGQTIFWSGAVAEGGQGPVDVDAHFYRSYLVDALGKHIDKSNLWEAREAAYINLIPPGGAEVARYRLKIPADCRDKITLTAKLNYRKFSWAHTQWAFSGVNHSSSGAAQNGTIPIVPVIEMARDEVTLAVASPGMEVVRQPRQNDTPDWKRWNDYGIGLLLQGDLKNAEAAFMRIAQIAPDNAEAWLNAGIARWREGNLSGAHQAFETAMKMSTKLPQVNYYYGLTLKAQGQHEEALKYFKRLITKYPRDRVARNERGHLYLLMKDYPRAIRDFEKVLNVDPENVEAYYHLIRAYRALGDEENAKKAEKLYERFKAGEPLRSDAGFANQEPHVRRERQPLHEHTSTTWPANFVGTPPAANEKTSSSNH